MTRNDEQSDPSTGSGSGLPPHLIHQPAWMEKARGMTFMGVPLDQLSRYELLAVVGYLADQVEQERKFHRSTVDILKAASAVSE